MDSNIEFNMNIETKLKQMKSDYLKIENILNNLNSFYSKFFNMYLRILSKFLSSINKTLNYFYKKIIIEKNSDKESIEDFDNFIYYIFNYDYLTNNKKIMEIISYFENYFDNNQYNKKEWEIDNYKFILKDNSLYQID